MHGREVTMKTETAQLIVKIKLRRTNDQNYGNTNGNIIGNISLEKSGRARVPPFPIQLPPMPLSSGSGWKTVA
jgi:hypothetical protein